MVYRWLTSPQVRSFQTDDCDKSSPNYKASIQIVRTGYRVLCDYGLTGWGQNRRWKGIVVASMLSFIRFRCALHKCPVNTFKSKEWNLTQEQLPKTILMLSKKPRSSAVRIKDIVSDLANAEIGGRGVQVHWLAKQCEMSICGIVSQNAELYATRDSAKREESRFY